MKSSSKPRPSALIKSGVALRAKSSSLWELMDTIVMMYYIACRHVDDDAKMLAQKLSVLDGMYTFTTCYLLNGHNQLDQLDFGRDVGVII